MSDKASSADNQQGRLNVNLSPDYIVGLVDGEGYFSVTAAMEHYKTYSAHRVRLVFGIELNDTDGQILYNIRDWFQCGRVRLRKVKKENWSNRLEYQVRDMVSIREKIIPFFKKYSLKLPKRQKTFAKFVEIADMTEQGTHLSESGFQQLAQIANGLHHF